ncbi:ATPase [Selenomonas sp. ND2010]|jgi:cell division septum initiation protein DivIVA|uniref:ATPase n=1 Tax=Selenomonas sp. ND2010 TaxID=1410618 RepID=UPI00051BF7DA|nr:ATPase [Selenomonas sp. ND2010]
MSVRDTLDKLENMVVGASHFPFTEKTLINDNELIHYVDELRNDLPKELNRADEIMKNRDEIIRNAEKEAEQIKKEAKEYANRVTDENEIVLQAKEKAKTILQQTQQQEKEIMERTQKNAMQLQSDADAYANQVFDQLISHVTGTFQGVQQAEQGLQQALNVLKQAKAQMNQQAVRQAQQAAAVGRDKEAESNKTADK